MKEDIREILQFAALIFTGIMSCVFFAIGVYRIALLIMGEGGFISVLFWLALCSVALAVVAIKADDL